MQMSILKKSKNLKIKCCILKNKDKVWCKLNILKIYKIKQSNLMCKKMIKMKKINPCFNTMMKKPISYLKKLNKACRILKKEFKTYNKHQMLLKKIYWINKRG